MESFVIEKDKWSKERFLHYTGDGGVFMISQMHRMGACSSLLMRNMNFADIRTILKTAVEEKAVVPCNTAPTEDGKNYAFTDYAFVCASTSKDQRSTERQLKELGFACSERVQKKKNANTLCKFWMIEMPTLLTNLGFDPSEYGSGYG